MSQKGWNYGITTSVTSVNKNLFQFLNCWWELSTESGQRICSAASSRQEDTCELSTESCHGISSAASSRQVDGYELSTAPCHGASSATSTRCIGEWWVKCCQLSALSHFVHMSCQLSPDMGPVQQPLRGACECREVEYCHMGHYPLSALSRFRAVKAVKISQPIGHRQKDARLKLRSVIIIWAISMY